MLSFYFILLGYYLFYSRSKYFPQSLKRLTFSGSRLAATVLLFAGAGLFVQSDGWAAGLLLALVTVSLAMILLQFFGVLGRTYFYCTAAIVHFLVLIELINYAR